LRQIIKSIPEGNLIDYKILWRNPSREWVSKKGRIAALGDAAHPHLATAATGAAQAFEDAVTIATLLEHTGRDKIPLALKAYEVLRYGGPYHTILLLHGTIADTGSETLQV
jgi:2-polyprenyl-6-methoxyphenol hydroxylase-like FAD-dependent oxidoreductase